MFLAGVFARMGRNLVRVLQNNITQFNKERKSTNHAKQTPLACLSLKHRTFLAHYFKRSIGPKYAYHLTKIVH